MVIFLASCHAYKTTKAEDNKQLLEKHEIDKQVVGKVIFCSGPLACQWIIKLKDGKEFIPVKWPPNAKKHNQKIKFTFRLSRAPQPPCFKGKMIIIENHMLLK